MRILHTNAPRNRCGGVLSHRTPASPTIRGPAAPARAGTALQAALADRARRNAAARQAAGECSSLLSCWG
jgi:hypothetical protein